MAIASRDDGARPVVREETEGTRRGDMGVEANARMTGSIAAVLFVLLAAEGITVLRVHELISAHVFIGMLLVPPVMVKIGSTSYRFARYYLGAPAYRRKGPPPALMRLLGPVVVVLTVVVLASGVALVIVPESSRRDVLLVHKAGFVLWFGAMTVHVLGHLRDTAKLAPRDWMQRTRSEVSGVALRQWVIVSSLVAGALLGAFVVGRGGAWLITPLGPHLGH